MPGHVKLGKAGEADPDPLPYLVVTLEMKRADMLRPYDSKKSYWCPDGKHGFVECLVESNDGTKAVVMVGHEVKIMMNSRNYKEYFRKHLILCILELILNRLYIKIISPFLTEKDFQVRGNRTN